MGWHRYGSLTHPYSRLTSIGRWPLGFPELRYHVKPRAAAPPPPGRVRRWGPRAARGAGAPSSRTPPHPRPIHRATKATKRTETRTRPPTSRNPLRCEDLSEELATCTTPGLRSSLHHPRLQRSSTEKRRSCLPWNDRIWRGEGGYARLTLPRFLPCVFPPRQRLDEKRLPNRALGARSKNTIPTSWTPTT